MKVNSISNVSALTGVAYHANQRLLGLDGVPYAKYLKNRIRSKEIGDKFAKMLAMEIEGRQAEEQVVKMSAAEEQELIMSKMPYKWFLEYVKMWNAAA